MSAVIGPCRLLTFAGGLGDLVEGRSAPDLAATLDDRLPKSNSLRRASDETKAAVVAAREVLESEKVRGLDRVGIYVGQQQIALDYCTRFIDASYKEGPRLASPMLFSESVANIVATHLSLTLGLKGIAQTFIGTRAAGIQAVIAAREDLEAGIVEAGLVVALGIATTLTRDAYHAIYSPHARRRPPPDVNYLRGAVALLIRREAPGHPRISRARTVCFGRDEEAQRRAVETLRAEAGSQARIVTSTFCLARERSLRIIGSVPEGPDLAVGESFAVDPFLRLLVDSKRHPGPEPRTLICLGEEGTAGVLQLDGPLREA